MDNPRIEQFMEHLAGKLKNLSGREQYGHLKAPPKAVVDEIVDELVGDERIAQVYELWYELRKEVFRTYRENLPPRFPLPRQEGLKRIRNMVTEEALRPGYESTVLDPTAPEGSPLERDIAEADREASKEPGLSVDMEHIEPEGVRNHRGRSSNPYARYRLARIIFTGPAMEQKRLRTTLEWLTEATEAGLVHAQYRLGKIYWDGRGMEKDAPLTAVWLTRTAEQGSDTVFHALGVLLLTGREGLAEDILSVLN